MTNKNFDQKKRRVRSKIRAVGKRPRLSVFRSNKFIYAQIIDDEKGKTLVSSSGKKATKLAFGVGEELAKLAKGKKIAKVVFDRGSYRYHGRVKALAEGARKGGLNF
jgi:large subunit ribosomal protein L18